MGASFALDVAAIAILAYVVQRTEPASTGRSAAGGERRRGERSVSTPLIAGGAVVGVACSLLLYVDWATYLFTVFLVGPISLLVLSFGLDLRFGYGECWRPRVSAIAGALRSRENRAVAALVALAAFYRFYSFGDFPPPDGFSSIEEAQRATGARWIIERGARPWEWPFCQYLAAASFALFGRSMEALRVPVVLFGCATLLPFYGFTRRLAGPAAALFATALLAVSRWHVQVSWYNEDVYVPVFPFVVILWLLLRTREEPRPLWYVVIGACIGYTFYAYAAYRGTIGIVALFLLFEWLRRRSAMQEWRQLSICAGVVALFGLPLVSLLRRDGTFYFEALQRSFANRGYYTSDAGAFVAQRADRIRASAEAFTVTDRGGFLTSLNTGGEPLLDPFSGAVFILGLGLAVAGLRRPQRPFLVAAFLLLTFGATVVVQNLDFRRLSILIPFVFAFCAIAAHEIGAAATRLVGSTAARVALATIVSAAAVYNFHFLFYRLARDPAVSAYHRDDYTPPMFHLYDHHDGEYVVLLTAVVHNFFLPNDYDWLKPEGLEGRTIAGPEELFPLTPPPDPGRDVLVLMQRPFEIEVVMDRVRERYTGARCELRPDPDGAEKWDLGVCVIPAARR